MNGSTHKAIGVATGVSLVLYGATNSIPMLAIGMVTAPFGAMLPDIDHHNSKLGRTKDNIFKLIKRSSVAMMLAAVLILVLGVVIFNTELLKLGLVVLIMSAIVAIVLSDGFARKFPFLTKHRGIMHTFVVPAFLVLMCFGKNLGIISCAITGLAAGYVSHLLADSITVDKVPLLWPLSSESVGLGIVRTGTVFEYVAAVILGGLIIIIPQMYVNDLLTLLKLTLVLFSFSLGRVIMKNVRRIGRNLKKPSVSIIMSLAFVGGLLAWFLNTTDSMFRVSAALLVVGVVRGMFK
ncbi:MAG: metal-dependent hydrolase [Alphaproteobacteria bacterium]|nr:metal-dependent hydrolase [Alphaproteobacteria bacterium]